MYFCLSSLKKDKILLCGNEASASFSIVSLAINYTDFLDKLQ